MSDADFQAAAFKAALQAVGADFGSSVLGKFEFGIRSHTVESTIARPGAPATDTDRLEVSITPRGGKPLKAIVVVKAPSDVASFTSEFSVSYRRPGFFQIPLSVSKLSRILAGKAK